MGLIFGILRYFSVTLHLSPTTRIVNENPAKYMLYPSCRVWLFLETTQYYQFHFIVNNWIVVTFESVHEVMLCDHSNEMSFLQLSQDATLSASQHFYLMKFGNFVRV